MKSQRGELSELYDDGDNGEIKATGVKCKRHSQLPQTTMDNKESGKRAKMKGDNLVWFIQDLSTYLYRKKCLILAMEQRDDYLERKGPKLNPAYFSNFEQC